MKHISEILKPLAQEVKTNMSVRRFPIYVARHGKWSEYGCGHQHSTQDAAVNCATNMLAQHPTINEVSITRIRKPAKSDDVKSTVVQVVTRDGTLTPTAA